VYVYTHAHAYTHYIFLLQRESGGSFSSNRKWKLFARAGGKFRGTVARIAATGLLSRYTVLFIGNRGSTSPAHARREGRVTRTHAGRKARDVAARRASRRAFFGPVAFKRPPTRGRNGEKGRKRAFKNERGVYTLNNTKRPRWQRSCRSPALPGVSRCRLNGYSLTRATHLPLPVSPSHP